MYLKNNNPRKISIKVTQDLSFSKERSFSIFSTPVSRGGPYFTAIRCSEGAESSHNGAIVLPCLISKYESKKIKIIFDLELNDHFIEIRKRKYYFSLVKEVITERGFEPFVLIEQKKHIKYFCGNEIKKHSVLFYNIPVNIWHELLLSYKNTLAGSPPSILHSAINVAKQTIVLGRNSQQRNINDQGQRNIFGSGAFAMRSILFEVIHLLKGKTLID